MRRLTAAAMLAGAVLVGATAAAPAATAAAPATVVAVSTGTQLEGGWILVDPDAFYVTPESCAWDGRFYFGETWPWACFWVAPVGMYGLFAWSN